MPTKTPREKIHELIKQNYNENTARCVVALVMPVFDALLEEARQEGREEGVRDYFVKTYYEESGKQPSEEEIRSSISSL